MHLPCRLVYINFWLFGGPPAAKTDDALLFYKQLRTRTLQDPVTKDKAVRSEITDMFRIERVEALSSNIYLMDVYAPRIARNALPGQFLIVRVDEEGERIPLTICDYDAEAGTVQIVFQTVGAESYRMAQLKKGDHFADFVGPLGRPSDLCEMPLEELRKMKLCFIAGGVGTAPVYAQLKWLKAQGVTADCIQGARSKDMTGLWVDKPM